MDSSCQNQSDRTPVQNAQQANGTILLFYFTELIPASRNQVRSGIQAVKSQHDTRGHTGHFHSRPSRGGALSNTPVKGGAWWGWRGVERKTRTGQDRDETEKTLTLFKIAERQLIYMLLVHTWNQLQTFELLKGCWTGGGSHMRDFWSLVDNCHTIPVQKELLMLGSDDVIEQ